MYTKNEVSRVASGTLANLILDSSLISESKNKNYDLKIVQCGDYYQIYNYKNIKIKKNKNIEKLKRKFTIKTEYIDINKYINKYKLTKHEQLIQNEYIKFYKNSLYDFHSDFNIKKIDTENLKKLENKDINNKDIELKNINRSKIELQRLVKSNIEEFKTFITLTFEENLKDIEQANKIFHVWCRNLRRLKKDLKYICVPEFQKRGAVHYHLLTNIDYEDTTLLSLEERHIYNKKSGWQVGKDIKGWKYGHNMAKNLKNINVVGYITKYMTKDIDNRLWGKRRYLYSQNLRKPNIIYLDTNNIEEFKKYIELTNSSELVYNNTYLTRFDDTIEFNEYKKSDTQSIIKTT